MKYPRRETPAYVIWVEGRPRKKGQRYREAVRRAAAAEISKAPITTDDVEVEIAYSTTRKERPDVDNAVKPTLDGLRGYAFKDDVQVRSVTVARFHPLEAITPDGRCRVSGLVEHLKRLFIDTRPRDREAPKEVTRILVYSDTWLEELGGEEAVKAQRKKEWDREWNSQFPEGVAPRQPQ